MKVDKELIEKVALLARLELSEDEKKQLEADFAEILSHFSKRDECDTTGYEGVLHPVELSGTVREDAPGKCLGQEEALSLAEHKKDGYFKGPRAV
jgi:aspartyl-tRNA(Asn)/glutamyl-tRNA(Gln) amidotransferase subunit C